MISPSLCRRKDGPCRAKTCLRAYADSEGPDQHAHPRTLIRAFAVSKHNLWILQDGSMESKCPDETFKQLQDDVHPHILRMLEALVRFSRPICTYYIFKQRNYNSRNTSASAVVMFFFCFFFFFFFLFSIYWSHQSNYFFNFFCLNHTDF